MPDPASSLPRGLDLLVLGPDVYSSFPIQALPLPARFHELRSRVSACAALLEALVVAVAAAPAASNMNGLLVLAETRRSL